MTAQGDDRWVRTLATLTMALSAPVALLSGILTMVSVPNGVPRFLVVVLVVSLATLALATLLYLSDDIRHRGAE